MKHFFPATLLACLLPVLSLAQAVPSDIESSVIERLTDEIRQFPQEKVYLQTDKPYYSAGDTLWFKAYLVHSALHSPMHYSRYIYTEIINDLSQVVFRERVRPENDMYYCQIPLKAEFTPGHYRLRAYTNYMRNLPEDYFFSKEIYIGNAIKSESEDNGGGFEGLQFEQGSHANDVNRRANSNAAFEVQFLPEGGNLISGITQTVAFKALAKDGLSCTVHGTLVDNDGNEVTTFSSSWLGMGTIGLYAQAGKTYKAICENELGEECTVDLPLPTDATYSIAANLRNDMLRVSVLVPDGKPLEDSLYLLLALRGVPLITTPVPMTTPQVAIPTDRIPGGVMQLVLFNSHGEALSERLIFNPLHSHPNVSVTFDKSKYAKRERVNAKLHVTDADGNPLKGDLSLTVTDDRYIRNDSDALTIESYMLLASDLRGNIEKPGAYFHGDRSSSLHLDLLMLTQGWRRYDLPAIMRGERQKFDTYELEVGSSICGRLQTYPIRRAVPGVNISVFNSQNGYVNAINTDNTGRFCFEGFEFADSSTFFVQAAKKEGQILELTLKSPDFPSVGNSVIIPREDVVDQTMISFLNKSREKYYYENGNMIINLDAAVVTAKAVDNLRQDRGAMYTDPSYSFDETALQDMQGMDIIDILLQVPGVTLDATGEGVLIRNATPAVYVDNLQYSMSDLKSISVFDVELIDVLKDPTQTMLYQGGNNGVIVIYLKRGKKNNQDVELGSHQKRFNYLGYTTAREFYQPIYSVEKIRLDPTPDLRSTIYWKPDIVLDENGDAEVRFYTSDEKSTYSVIIEGMGVNGEIVRAVKKISRQ